MPLSKEDLLGSWTLDEWYVEDERAARMTFSGAPPGSTGTHVIVWKRR